MNVRQNFSFLLYCSTHGLMYCCSDVYSCTAVLRYSCTAVLRYLCTAVHLYLCTLLQPYCCTYVQLNICTYCTAVLMYRYVPLVYSALQCTTIYMELIAFPDQAARFASLNASLQVGWAWQTRAMSSQLAPYSIARAA